MVKNDFFISSFHERMKQRVLESWLFYNKRHALQYNILNTLRINAFYYYFIANDALKMHDYLSFIIYVAYIKDTRQAL